MMSRRNWSIVCSVLLLHTAMQTIHTTSAAAGAGGRPSSPHGPPPPPPQAEVVHSVYTAGQAQQPKDVLLLLLVSSTTTIRDEKKKKKGLSSLKKKGRRTLGSRPPSCDHKCRGCRPCAAIQVPTTTTGRVRLQYANYEPEGWKCKCGSSLYNP